MSRNSLELRMLARVPAKFRNDPDREWPCGQDGLDQVYGPAPEKPDDWHAVLKIRSRYWTMDDIKAYIRDNRPEGPSLDFSSWSMTGGYGGRDIIASFQDGAQVRVTESEYDALATEHVDGRLFENLRESWSLDLPYGHEEWLAPLLPCYITEALLRKLPEMRLAFARKSDPGDLIDRISDAGRYGCQEPDVLGFLSDGLVHAKKNRCALWACLVD